MAPPPPADTRQRILHEAVRLFADCGYAGVSMRDIARAVGITPAGLYNHFPGKAELYRAAVEAAFAHKQARLLAALQDGSAPHQRLARFVHALAAVLDEDDRFRRLMQRELLDGDAQRLDFLARFIVDAVQRPFMALLRELRPEADACLLSELILGMVKQHYEMQPLHPYLPAAHGTRYTPRQVAEAVLAVLAPYVHAGARP